MRAPSALLAFTLWLPACGSGPETGDADAALTAALAGTYRVEGVTVDDKTGNRRDISGTVILARADGDTYTATFDLDTVYAFLDEEVQAEVIGKGEAALEGRTLRGTAQTQIVMASVPGIDPGFAYVPRLVSTRIVSTSVGRVESDGSLTIEIQNAPAEGEDYSPTRTRLRGTRVAGDAEAGQASAP